MTSRARLDRDLIVQTAARLADEYGLAQVTLANLAQELGVRSPSLYNHVNGLQEVRDLLTVHALNMLLQQMIRIDRESKDQLAPKDSIHALGRAYLDFARSHPGLYEAGLIKAQENHQSEIKELSDELVGLFVNVLKRYGLRDDEVIHAVRGLRCLLHGFATLEQQDGFGLSVDTDASFTYMMDKYLSGLQSSTHTI